MAPARYTVQKTEKSFSLDPAVAWHIVDNETGRVVQYARLRRDAIAWARAREELHVAAHRTVMARVEAMREELNRVAAAHDPGRSIF